MTMQVNSRPKNACSLEIDFPIGEISQIAEQESWRKEIYRPLYHIHKWWATRLGSVFRAVVLAAIGDSSQNTWSGFYKRHRLTDKIVLDPFMGSGTTLGEASKLGAKVIGCDINPISSFLVKQAFTKVSEEQLREALEKLDSSVAKEIKSYYRTRDPLTGEQIPVLYYFWVKTVCTPEGEIIPLFSSYVFAKDAYTKKKPKAQIVCSNCWALIEGRYDATDVECKNCNHRFNPQVGPALGQYVTTSTGMRYRIKDILSNGGGPPQHRLYAILALRSNGEKAYFKVEDYDLKLFADAEKRLQHEFLPLPTLEVRPGNNTDQARGYNYAEWRDFFNARQLLCLGLLLKAILDIEDVAVQEQLLCLFSSTLEFNNLFCSYKGEGTGAVRHMFSHHILKPERTPLENSVWGNDKSSGTFLTLFETRLLPAKQYLDRPFEIAFETNLLGERIGATKIVASDLARGKLVTTWDELCSTDSAIMILNGDSAQLPLPDGCVDAIITDPPYFDFIHYSELSDFFFAWLAPVLKNRYTWFDREDSSAPGEVQHKDPIVFATQLASVFSEGNRVLKSDGLLAFTFHHSKAEGWEAIYDAVRRAGFAIVAAHPVHAELRASSPKSAAKDPISIDAILVCKKHRPSSANTFNLETVISRANSLIRRLEIAGMLLSNADRSVIIASQTLVALSVADYDTKFVLSSIYSAQQRFSQSWSPIINRYAGIEESVLV